VSTAYIVSPIPLKNNDLFKNVFAVVDKVEITAIYSNPKRVALNKKTTAHISNITS